MSGQALSFSTILQHLKAGGAAARTGWNGKNMWIKLQVPDENSKMSRPYLYMRTADQAQVPWVASQSDILAEDWQVVPIEEIK